MPQRAIFTSTRRNVNFEGCPFRDFYFITEDSRKARKLKESYWKDKQFFELTEDEFKNKLRVVKNIPPSEKHEAIDPHLDKILAGNYTEQDVDILKQKLSQGGHIDLIGSKKAKDPYPKDYGQLRKLATFNGFTMQNPSRKDCVDYLNELKEVKYPSEDE